MEPATLEVVLLSAVPEAHSNLLRGLRSYGVEVAIAQGASRAIRRMRRSPVLVLVDLVHGAGIGRADVSRLNSARGQSIVVALHEGGFGQHESEIANLSVDGFCRAENWRPIAGFARGQMYKASQFVH
jgi:ActR/RegA family two-component response regulator